MLKSGLKWIKVVIVRLCLSVCQFPTSKNHCQPMIFEPFNTRLTLDPEGRLTLPIQLRHALSAQGINRLVAIGNDGDNGGLSLFTLSAYRDSIAAELQTSTHSHPAVWTSFVPWYPQIKP